MGNCIGLFGTCGSTTWRKDMFIPFYESNGLKELVDFYNPQVEDWNPDLAAVEAEHLANDRIILFPVTSETYGSGSLSEVGFSILQAIKLDDRRDIIIMIQPFLDEHLMLEDPVSAKNSLRDRQLVIQHLKKLNIHNVHVIDPMYDTGEKDKDNNSIFAPKPLNNVLQNMAELSLLLFNNNKRLLEFKKS